LALLDRKDRVLGIDISASAVKLVELSRSEQHFKVEAIAIEPLPAGTIEERNPSDLDGLTAAIKRAYKNSSSRLKKAAVAVPTSSVITRIIPMPAEFGEEDIATNIQIDAAQYIPFPLEEIYLDFQIQGASKGSSDTQDVMLVASRLENVDLRREVLQDAGLKAVIVDVEAYALENAFRVLIQEPNKGKDDKELGAKTTLAKLSDNHLTAVVDIGAAITTLYVLRGDRTIFTREQAMGGEQLTNAISEAYDLPRERAEQVKRAGSGLPDDYLSNVLTPYLEFAAEQIRQALQFYSAADHYHSDRNAVDTIILVGGGALITGLDKIVTDRLNIPTVVGNPFVSMSSSPRINRHALLRDAPLYAVACGLALRSFD
jgi:type IV pilus assembly protein PilM